jgi:hypothetical protein
MPPHPLAQTYAQTAGLGTRVRRDAVVGMVMAEFLTRIVAALGHGTF